VKTEMQQQPTRRLSKARAALDEWCKDRHRSPARRYDLPAFAGCVIFCVPGLDEAATEC